jgi:hypothetical protein
MRWIIDTLLWFRGQNFTVKSVHHIDREGFIRPGPGIDHSLTEYIYNLKTMWYFGGTEWPPVFTSRCRPIKKVIRESGTDITSQVLMFAGPLKNEISPIAFVDFTKRWKFRFRSPCGIQLSLETHVEHVNETVYVETVLNQCFRVEPDKI